MGHNGPAGCFGTAGATMVKRWKLYLALTAWRVLNALHVRTYFSPDEYWQGPEVAYSLVYGRGLLTWEWLEGARIRSFLHPGLISILYWALKVLGLDTRDAIAYGPSFFQGLLAAVCDLYVYLLAGRIFQSPNEAHMSEWTLFVQVCNWFNWYCGVRTFASSLEVVLFTVALYHWLGPQSEWLITASKKQEAASLGLPDRAVSWEERLAIVVGTSGVMVRPTGALLWVAPGLWRLSHTRRPVRYLLLEVVPWAGVVMGLCTALDCLCYGSITFPAWNFLRFNLLEGKSRLYGSHGWHWLFTAGLATVLTSQLPFFLLGLQQATATNRPSSSVLRVLCAICLVYTLGLSAAAHKEFRFLHPLLPLTSLLTALGLAHVQAWINTRRPRKTGAGPSSSSSSASPKRGAALLCLLLVLTQCPMAWYLSRYHQRGPIDALAFLSTHLQHLPPPKQGEPIEQGEPIAIHFLLPCHATPFHTHLHVQRPLALLHLDCSPEARASQDGSESDRFLNDPLAYADALYATEPLPQYMLMFGSAAQVLKSRLEAWGYRRLSSFFYSSFNGDSDSPQLESSMLLYHRTVT